MPIRRGATICSRERYEEVSFGGEEQVEGRQGKREKKKVDAQLSRPLPRMRKVAQNRQRKLLQRRVVPHDPLQQGDRPRRGGFGLTFGRETAEVEESVDGVVLDFLRAFQRGWEE
jgi:hypothetical protein